MNAELKAKWVAALRSGDYKQTRGTLKDLDLKVFCCLGVLCEVAYVDVSAGNHASAYDAIRKLILDTVSIDGEGIPGVIPAVDRLIELNDAQFADFTEIADFIDENIPGDGKPILAVA
jgi:hypothetical protein